MLLLHGSHLVHPEGLTLTARPDQGSGCFAMEASRILEMFRPEHFIAHDRAVFMAGSVEDLDACGAYLEHVYLVRPGAPPSRHDLRWSTEITVLLDEVPVPADCASADPRIAKATASYWAGHPHADGPVWEYLAVSAEVLSEISEELDADQVLMEATLDALRSESAPPVCE